jgi:hypothetical protein
VTFADSILFLEGALAKKLYFQFADTVVLPHDILTLLFQQGLQRMSYMAIWMDVFNEVRTMAHFETQ